MASIITFLKTLLQKLAALLSKKKGEEVVDYYGCPNSNKARKLQMKKNIIK